MAVPLGAHDDRSKSRRQAPRSRLAARRAQWHFSRGLVVSDQTIPLFLLGSWGAGRDLWDHRQQQFHIDDSSPRRSCQKVSDRSRHAFVRSPRRTDQTGHPVHRTRHPGLHRRDGSIPCGPRVDEEFEQSQSVGLKRSASGSCQIRCPATAGLQHRFLVRHPHEHHRTDGTAHLGLSNFRRTEITLASVGLQAR